ncbi:MAG: cyclic nucleotide-binding domain-containing protein [Pseudobdellovibrionaceae bacterium]
MVNYLWENFFRNQDKNQNLRQKLKQNILFQDLNFSELSLVEKIVNVRHYRPGESIFKQGEVGVGMYIILSGVVNIYVEELQAATGASYTTHVTQLKSGDFFGELALVETEGRRSASATAHEECLLVGFFKPDLIEIIERSPSAGVKILSRLGEVLGARLRQTTARITELKKEGRRQ